MPTTDKFIVVTTVNAPTESVQKLAQWKGWQLVVVGDKKTPKDWHLTNAIYLSVEDQYRFFGHNASVVPLNAYQRKNLGYLYAIQHGARAIFETDDDNIPYDNAQQIVDAYAAAQPPEPIITVSAPGGFLNVYRSFTSHFCWPRGLPLDMIRSEESLQVVENSEPLPYGVVHFLPDGDADFDAIYRLAINKEVKFEGKPIALKPNTYAPLNSQSTLWLEPALKLMELPLCPQRLTDILRGYRAQKKLWDIGYTVAYAPPVVYQKRNPHNIADDFREEQTLYVDAQQWKSMILSDRHWANYSLWQEFQI